MPIIVVLGREIRFHCFLVPWFSGGRRPPAKFFDLVRVFFRRPKAASEILGIAMRVFWRPKAVSNILRCGTVVSNHLKETVVPKNNRT